MFQEIVGIWNYIEQLSRIIFIILKMTQTI